MANCANAEGDCWPSVKYLSDCTAQDRKTVIENVKRLIDGGFIEAQDERRGATSQVVVYRLRIGAEQSQKRNSSENGTVPKTDAKSTENGHKESRFLPERVPKTGHGTVRNHKEPSVNRNTAPAAPEVLAADLMADGLDAELAAAWLAHRKAKKARLSRIAWDGVKREAGRAGWSVSDAVRKAIERDWRSFEAKWVRDEPRRGTGPPASDPEPEWRRIQRERNEAFLGPYAAKRQATKTVEMEPSDGAVSNLD